MALQKADKIDKDTMQREVRTFQTNRKVTRIFRYESRLKEFIYGEEKRTYTSALEIHNLTPVVLMFLYSLIEKPLFRKNFSQRKTAF